MPSLFFPESIELNDSCSSEDDETVSDFYFGEPVKLYWILHSAAEDSFSPCFT